MDRLHDFASHAQSMADDEEFRGEFLKWLDDFQPPKERTEEWGIVALAVRVRLGAFGDNWATASPHLMDLLDYPDPCVRAATAQALGKMITTANDESPFATLMADIHDRELERPGIAGPFYEGIYYDLGELADDGHAYVKSWMLSILENRRAHEPRLLDYHFNGIDFHAHELFADDPEGIRELMRIGRIDIAAEAATDTDERIEGMEAVLVELGSSDDYEACRLASWHLAYNYRVLHPCGRQRGFVSRTRISGGEELFLNGHPENPSHPYAAILYPKVGLRFTFDEVRQWILRLLPAELRGGATSFFPKDWPGPSFGDGYVLRDKVGFHWAFGAMGTLKGDVSAQEWDSLTIIWHGDKETWTPGEYVDVGESPC